MRTKVFDNLISIGVPSEWQWHITNAVSGLGLVSLGNFTTLEEAQKRYEFHKMPADVAVIDEVIPLDDPNLRILNSICRAYITLTRQSRFEPAEGLVAYESLQGRLNKFK